jgi:hydrophobic/amphiphilic exporter-1 (mainly G- bacteria), HAE1 family
MRALAETCIKRPVFAAMLVGAMVVVGWTAYQRLGVDRLPSVDVPNVNISVSLPGASPEEMEQEIVQRIENAVNTVEGIDELRSVSGMGNCWVSATFNLKRDIDAATQDIRDRVSNVMRDLPDDTDPPVITKVNNDDMPVLVVAISGDRPLRELTELADKIIRPQLERAPGVGRALIYGGIRRAINVWVDGEKLAAYQIPITAVRDAVTRQNLDVAGGNVTGATQEHVLRTAGKFEDAEQFNELVITTINGVPIRIKDIGNAEDGTKEQRSITRLNGQPTVTLNIQRQSRSEINTIQVIEGAKAALRKLEQQIPPDVRIEVIRDQSKYIYAALHEINVHLILGGILASLVVFAFMRSWRSTIIAAIAIPTSIVATFGVMWAMNFTLNSVTMLALVLMVGVVIDDAIVVLENIFRFIEEKGMGPMEAARAATAEIALAVLATTLSLVVIFVPVAFMPSVMGRLLYQFGITAAVAVMVSMIVSFTLTPMMSSRLIHVRDHHKAGADQTARSRRGFYGLIDAVYTWCLTLTLRHRLLSALIAITIMASSVPLYQRTKQDLFPTDVDEAEFFVSVTGPEGTSIDSMDAAVRQIDADIREVRGVITTLCTSGSGFLGSVNNGNITVKMAPHPVRTVTPERLWKGLLAGDIGAAFRGNYSQTDVMQDIRRRISKYKDLRCQVRSYPAFRTGGSGHEIDFAIRGPDLRKLFELADELRLKTLKIPGIMGPDTTLKLDKPELLVHPDRQRAADLGVDMRDVGVALRLMVGGETEISRFRDPTINEDYDVDLRLHREDRTEPGDITQLYLPRRGGGLVRLDNVASIERTMMPSRIDRLDRIRTVSVRASVGPGYAMGDRLAAISAAAAELDLPPGYTTMISGRGKDLERTFKEFFVAFTLSIVFMYMILAANYESLVHPFTILLSLPLCLPFALISMWWMGGALNLYSALGILVLFGVIKKNAILQIDHMNQLRARGMSRYDAVLLGNRERLRPILMTTLALVAGMLPLALGSGPGAEERRAVAIVVIGGQSLSLLLTLLLTPVVYTYLDDFGALWLRKHPKHPPEPTGRLAESGVETN